MKFEYKELREAELAHLVDAGDARACYWLARKYEFRQCDAPDMVRALTYYGKGADLGNLAAELRLNSFMLDGKYVGRNLRVSPLAFRQALSRPEAIDDPEALVEAKLGLGLCHLRGVGVRQDFKMAGELISQAADEGHPDAIYHLGAMFLAGEGVEESPMAAVGLFARAAQCGHSMGILGLGRCALAGYGMEKNEGLGFSLVRCAASRGIVEAYSDLATCYLEGRGVPLDLYTAARIYGAGANEGSADCMVGLALCFREGLGVPIDYARASALLGEAASRGNERAEEILRGPEWVSPELAAQFGDSGKRVWQTRVAICLAGESFGGRPGPMRLLPTNGLSLRSVTLAEAIDDYNKIDESNYEEYVDLAQAHAMALGTAGTSVIVQKQLVHEARRGDGEVLCSYQLDSIMLKATA